MRLLSGDGLASASHQSARCGWQVQESVELSGGAPGLSSATGPFEREASDSVGETLATVVDETGQAVTMHFNDVFVLSHAPAVV
jgi:hypothetical protein